MALSAKNNELAEKDNMDRKIRIILLFGGQSCEHEVSVTSASCIYDALDVKKFDANWHH